MMYRSLHRMPRTLLSILRRQNVPPESLARAPSPPNPEPFALHLSRIHVSGPVFHDDLDPSLPDVVAVTFVDKDGKEYKIKAKVGERALFLAHRYGIEMEGACEASLACTTCHCYVEAKNSAGKDFFDLLPEAEETEEDLLDMAPFLQENSRLGCQIFIKPELEGIRLRLPRATKNFYVDGHKPAPH